MNKLLSCLVAFDTCSPQNVSIDVRTIPSDGRNNTANVLFDHDLICATSSRDSQYEDDAITWEHIYHPVQVISFLTLLIAAAKKASSCETYNGTSCGILGGWDATACLCL